MPKKTTSVITGSKNDYLIGVKNNQRTLFKELQSTLTDPANESSSCITLEVNKGRTEWRHITVSDCIATISREWCGLQQIVKVHRRVMSKSEKSEQTAYFISSRKSNAFWYEEGIRSHWSIENTLHWVKDVTLKEDASRIKKGNAPQNISTLKNIGLNIFRENKYKNIAQAQRLVSNDINCLYNLII